jgi:hypothetical protein
MHLLEQNGLLFRHQKAKKYFYIVQQINFLNILSIKTI